jgi:hypothetical protein
MNPLPEIRQRIREARTRVGIAEDDLRRTDNRLAARTAALEQARRRGGGDADTRRLAAEVDELAAERQRQVAHRSAVRVALGDAVRQAANLAAPQRLVEQLDDRIPVLLLPVRVETRFMPVEAPTELWVRLFPDAVAVHTHEPALSAAEVESGHGFWREMWAAGRQGDPTERARREQGAWRALAGAAGSTRAAWVAARTRPASLAVPRADALAFPAVDPDALTAEAWTRAPHTRVMPDRFVVMTFAGGAQLHEVVGEPVADPLVLGPDPRAEGDLRQVDGDLVAGPDLAWIYAFEAAVAAGMGVRIPLDPGQARTGFDRILVLGLRLTADPSESARLVEELLESHRYAPDGMSALPQGVPTNRVGRDEPGSGTPDPTGDLTLEEALGAPRFEPTDDPIHKSDGQRLAEALGIDHQALAHLRFADRRDVGEAQAVNTALWPATGGYFLEEMLGLPLDGIDRLRAFFTRYVTGRGPLPAIRVGTQPYGILPTSALPRWEWSRAVEGGDLGFWQTVLDVMRRVDTQWTALVSRVGRVGAPGDPFATLLDIVGQQATSVEWFRRQAVGREYLWNYQLLGAGSEFAGSVQQQLDQQASQLRADLGFAFPSRPRLFDLTFFDGRDAIPDPFVADVDAAASERWSETTGLAAVYRVAGQGELQNYIGWLLRSSADELKGEVFRDANDQPRPFPKALLYRLLRHGLLLASHDAALRIYASRQLVDPGRARREVELPNVRADRTVTRWEFLEAPVREVAPDLSQAPLTLLQLLRQPRPTPLPETTSLAEVQGAIAELEGLPTARLERLLAEHLDLCAYRLDAWQTALFARRLEQQRFFSGGGFAARARGLHLGAYGWLEDLRPGPAPVPVDPTEVPDTLRQPERGPIVEQPDNAGFIHGFSLNHAVAAAVLRNAYLTHAEPDSARRMAVDLSSDRVRRALALLEGIRNGQELGALLGYEFERGLHDRRPELGLSRFVPAFRAQYPLVADTVTPDDGGDAEQKAARNVLDGYALAQAVFVKEPPLTYPFAVAGLPGDPGSDPARAIQAEVDRLGEALDAVADLALAEGVYQVVQGNHDRGAAMLKALSEGANPPEPEIVRTPRSGAAVTHRVVLHLPASDTPATAWPGPPTPRAEAEPGLNRWLGTILGPPDRIRYIVTSTTPPARTAALTVRDLGLQPIDLVYLVGEQVDAQAGVRGNRDDTTELESRISYAYRRRRRDADGRRDVGDVRIELVQRDPGWGPGDKTVFELLPLLRGVRDVVTSSRPLGADDYRLPSDAASVADPNPKGFDDGALKTRLEGRLAAFRAAGEDLTDAIAATEGVTATEAALDGLRAVLVTLANHGVPGAFPVDAVGATPERRAGLRAQARRVAPLVAQRRARAEALKELAELTPERRARATVEDRVEAYRVAAREILGAAFSLIPTCRLTNQVEVAAARAFRDAAPAERLTRFSGDALVVEEWLQGVARVRERVGLLESVCLLTDVFRGPEIRLAPLQLPFRSGDHWVAVEYPSTFAPAGDHLSLVQVLPTGAFDAAGEQRGVVVDEWTETIPGKVETTGIAVHYDQPSSEPPQVLLLAVTPRETGRWQWNDLVAILHDTLDRAKKRGVEPDHLADTAYAQLLPAVLAAVSSQRFATIAADLVAQTAALASSGEPAPG